MTEYDLTITAEHDGSHLLLHKPDCSFVKVWRIAGKPLCTMYGARGLPDVKRCQCLDNVEVARSAAG